MSAYDPILQLDLILPVHNEAESIESTLREFFAKTTYDRIDVRFLVCEDGSTDRTVEILKTLAQELPIHLITSPGRKGYSRAVIDGLNASTREYVAVIDSDGQCDPADLMQFVNAMGDADCVMGYRTPRRDHWLRILMSASFRLIYRMLFPTNVIDPSCPYLLIRRSSLLKVLSGNLGILEQGFWWEFIARVNAKNMRIVQVPVKHRLRTAGRTQVYRPTKVPRIAYEHIRGLFALQKELAQ